MIPGMGLSEFLLLLVSTTVCLSLVKVSICILSLASIGSKEFQFSKSSAKIMFGILLDRRDVDVDAPPLPPDAADDPPPLPPPPPTVVEVDDDEELPAVAEAAEAHPPLLHETDVEVEAGLFLGGGGYGYGK